MNHNSINFTILQLSDTFYHPPLVRTAWQFFKELNYWKMKQPTPFQLSLSFLLIFFIVLSCKKDTVRSTVGCAACSARTSNQPLSVRVIVDDWILINPGRYNSNLYAAIKKYANGISNISNITVVVDDDGSDKPLWRGTPIAYSNGNLLWRGETLFYSTDPNSLTNNQPGIKSLVLQVTVH